MNQVLFRNLDEVKKNLDLNTKKILFLTSEGHIKRRSIDKLQPFISTKELLISPVEPLPSFKSILNLVEEIKGKKFDFLISLGGGSVIDTSKTLSLLLGNEDQPWDLFNTENIGKIKDLKSLRNISHLAIPTTSGSGAEATSFSTIWNFEESTKYSLENSCLMPSFVLIDDIFLNTLNFENTLYPGLDALSHCFDTFLNVNNTPESIEFSKNAIKLFDTSFLELIRSLDNSKLRINIHKASYEAGKAININKTSITHALSYALTMKYNVPHGLACAIFIKPIFDLFNDKISKLYTFEYIEKIYEIVNSLDLNLELKKYTKKIDSDIYNLTTVADRLKNFMFNFQKSDIEIVLKKIN